MDDIQRTGLNPGIYRHATVPSRKAVMPVRPKHELRALLPTDWDVGVACVLATVGVVPQASLHRFLAEAPSVSAGTGCDGWLAQIAARFGVAFDPAALFALSSEKALYNKIQSRSARFETFRSFPLVSPALRDATEHVRGLQAAWCLSPLGASSLQALSVREPAPKAHEFSFPTNPDGFSPATIIHDAQLATTLMSLFVDFSHRAQAEGQLWDVVDAFGTGERFGTGGAAMFPDAVVKLLAAGKQATLIIENDSGTMSEARIQGKAAAYLRYMCSGSALFTWARPWLVFLCPKGKLPLHERAIASAYAETGLSRLDDAGVGIGRVAVVTHEDVGALGVATDVFSLYSPRRTSLLGNKHALCDLAWCPQSARADIGWRCA